MSGLDPQAGVVELTPRRCRWCRGVYLAPKGERWAGCRDCAPTFTDAIEGTVGNGQPDGATACAEQPARSPSVAVPPTAPEAYPERPHWTQSECQVKGCGRLAEVNADGWLVCAEHAEDWLDRVGALALRPELAELLPALGDR
jgi:hypothetical protein